MKKPQTVHYLTRDKKNDTREYLSIKWVTELVEGSNSKRYHNTISLLAGLSKCASLLILFLTEEMTEKNIIINTTKLKNDFNNLLIKGKENTYSHSSIQRAFRELTEKNFVKNLPKRGMYYINPKYFFKGSEENRIKAIRIDYERPNHELVRKFRKIGYKKDMEIKEKREK